jgi:drug/metabolite transporter (DMT)-like permease
VTFPKYLVLAGVTVFAAAGDSMLSHGMKQAGNISIHHLQAVVLAILNPWVAVGILLLLAFFASYMNALSWADLTYVLPATSMGYVLLALVARFLLHEQVSPLRWLGIALISGGVGFVAGGPALTAREPESEFPFDSAQGKLLTNSAGRGEPDPVAPGPRASAVSGGEER